MLTVTVRSEAIAMVQAHYRKYETMAGTHMAESIRQMRVFMEHAAKRFRERQARASAMGKPFLADGRVGTLQRELFAPLAIRSWPSPAAAVLHGLQPDQNIGMPDQPDRHGGRTIADRDPHSYWTVIHDGPDRARTFGGLAGIAVYLDPFTTFEILWIGPSVDLTEAWDDLLRRHDMLTDWSELHPAYDRWLSEHP